MGDYLGWLVTYLEDDQRVIRHLIEFQILGDFFGHSRAFALCFCEEDGCVSLVDVLDPAVDFQVEGQRGGRPLKA